jgi:putative ABC transport system ATP-binding protein
VTPSNDVVPDSTLPHAVLEARGLHRFYERGDDEVAALRDVSFSVGRGELLAVVGPSGSGKSTLLSLLAGLDEPDGGNVWIEGKRLTHRSNRDTAVVRGCCIGVLTQQSGLIDHLSVLGNVELGSVLRRRAQQTRLARSLGFGNRSAGPKTTLSSSDVLEALGLTTRAGARPSTLSGGETARANLAVALAEGPLVLLADEPTAEVSRHEEAALLDAMSVLRPRDGAAVVVTHSTRVAGVADRVIELVDGRQA